MNGDFLVSGLEETECIYDYLTTGREEIALATRQAIQEYETVIQDLKPGTAFSFLPWIHLPQGKGMLHND